MLSLSDQQKSIIASIRENQVTDIYTFLVNYCKKRLPECEFPTPARCVRVRDKDTKPILERVDRQDLRGMMEDFVLVWDLLAQDKIIVKFQNNKGNKVLDFGKWETASNGTQPDKKLYGIARVVQGEEFLVHTQRLQQFIDRGYTGEQEHTNSRNLQIQRISVIVTLIVATAALAVNVWVGRSSLRQAKKTLDSSIHLQRISQRPTLELQFPDNPFSLSSDAMLFSYGVFNHGQKPARNHRQSTVLRPDTSYPKAELDSMLRTISSTTWIIYPAMYYPLKEYRLQLPRGVDGPQGSRTTSNTVAALRSRGLCMHTLITYEDHMDSTYRYCASYRLGRTSSGGAVWRCLRSFED